MDAMKRKSVIGFYLILRVAKWHNKEIIPQTTKAIMIEDNMRLAMAYSNATLIFLGVSIINDGKIQSIGILAYPMFIDKQSIRCPAFLTLTF